MPGTPSKRMKNAKAWNDRRSFACTTLSATNIRRAERDIALGSSKPTTIISTALDPLRPAIEFCEEVSDHEIPVGFAPSSQASLAPFELILQFVARAGQSAPHRPNRTPDDLGGFFVP